jgi:hypothetical protein
MAIKKGRLKAIYEKKRFWVEKEELIRYHETKYSRLETKFQGEPLYDLDNGEISVVHAAKLSGVRTSCIYFHLRKGNLRGKRKGHHWILNHTDVCNFHKELHSKKEDPRQIKFA